MGGMAANMAAGGGSGGSAVGPRISGQGPPMI